MIKFDALYSGDVAIEKVGYSGTPVNDRWYPNEHLATVFDNAEAICKLVDRMGYDTLWMAEHHFQREGYECISNILLLSLHLAHLTDRIKFGCAFNITPMWHPLRLAEDYATVDTLTRGRVRFGVGRGYHTREVETFGSPLQDQSANRDLFEEGLEIIFKALNERSFSHHGKHYDIPPRVPYRGYELEEITLVPRPLNRPVECWQPVESATQRSLDFMAKHGIKGVVRGRGDMEAVNKVIAAYRDAFARSDSELALGENLGVWFVFHLAESQKKGIQELAANYEEDLKHTVPTRNSLHLNEEQINQMNNPRRAPFADLPTLQKAVDTGDFLCGPPSLIIERLKKLEERYPKLERILISQPLTTPLPALLEQLEWFSEEVIPAFAGEPDGSS